MDFYALEKHAELVRRDLELLDYPRREWTIARRTSAGENVLDCLIIGGGQGGLAVAAALGREKVRNILVVDAAPAGNEGPWRTFGRMITLRTPKYLTGPDGGVPSLTIRAWYEAQHGEGAWEKLDQFPKEMWADYLAWFRTVLELPVQNDTRAGAIRWVESERCFSVPLEGPEPRVVWARTVVLATGIEGSGAWHTPPQVSESLPPHLYAHTHTEIGFPDLHGKRVAILGAGACAFDNAAVALEHGATSVDLFFRRRELVRVNPYRWGEFTGFLKHHADLPDADKWKFILQLLKMGQLPPASTFKRATRFDNFHIHPASPLTNLKNEGEEIHLETPHGKYLADFLIVGTGFQTDLGVRPELPENCWMKIALWRDRYTPPENAQSTELARHPYLGANFEFTEKTRGQAPYLNAIFNYTFGCLLSLGFGGASISGMKYSLPRVVAGVTKRLYVEDSDRYFENLQAYDAEDF